MGVDIRVENLNAWYGPVHTLKDVSLHIRANQCTALSSVTCQWKPPKPTARCRALAALRFQCVRRAAVSSASPKSAGGSCTCQRLERPVRRGQQDFPGARSLAA